MRRGIRRRHEIANLLTAAGRNRTPACSRYSWLKWRPLTNPPLYIILAHYFIDHNNRFERVEVLVEMGEWMTGRGLARAGSDYLRSALDLIYDVEEKVRAVSYPWLRRVAVRGPSLVGVKTSGLLGPTTRF